MTVKLKPEEGGKMPGCIIYFSHSGENYVDGKIQNLVKGNTEILAELIQSQSGWLLCPLESVVTYSSDYDRTKSQAKAELEQDLPVTYQPLGLELNEYQKILLGFPNWWGTFPQVVKTFFNEQDLAGKTIYPFCTHEGSAFGRSISDLKRLCPKSKIALELPVIGSRVLKAKPAVRNWLAVVND